VRQAAEIAQRAEHRRLRQTNGLAQRQRRERIGEVVAAGDAELGCRQQGAVAARQPVAAGSRQHAELVFRGGCR